jgi:ADP-ribose pyrophosphatase YjhB (NUDIX family)
MADEVKKKMGIGFGVMVLREGKVLLGHRHEDPEKASSLMHGEGTWTMPGGSLKFHEDLKDAALREVLEETGIILKKDDLKIVSVTNDTVPDNHFVTIGWFCDKCENQEPKVMEPDEITEWRWFDLNELPKPLFFPSEKVLKNYLDGEIYKH